MSEPEKAEIQVDDDHEEKILVKDNITVRINCSRDTNFKRGKCPYDKAWAWLMLAGASYGGMLYFGTVKSLGIFYMEWLERVESSPEAISALLSVAGFLRMFGSFLGGYIFDNMTLRALRDVSLMATILAAGAISVSGWLINLPSLIIFFGIITSLFTGMMHATTLALPSKLFEKYTRLGMSIQFASCSLGGVVLPLLVQVFSALYSYPGTMLMLGGLFLQSIPGVCLYGHWDNLMSVWLGSKIKQNDADTDVHDEKSPAVKETENNDLTKINGCDRAFFVNIFRSYFDFFMAPNVALALFITLLIAFSHINHFIALPPLLLELGYSSRDVTIVLSVSSVMEIPSRLIFGVLLDRRLITESMAVVITGFIMGGVGCCMSQIAQTSLNVFYVWIGYGALVGLLGSIAPLFLVSSVRHMGRHLVGRAAGSAQVPIGVSVFLGPLLIGAVHSVSGTYTHTLATFGCACFLASCLALYVYCKDKAGFLAIMKSNQSKGKENDKI